MKYTEFIYNSFVNSRTQYKNFAQKGSSECVGEGVQRNLNVLMVNGKIV